MGLEYSSGFRMSVVPESYIRSRTVFILEIPSLCKLGKKVSGFDPPNKIYSTHEHVFFALNKC